MAHLGYRHAPHKAPTIHPNSLPCWQQSQQPGGRPVPARLPTGYALNLTSKKWPASLRWARKRIGELWASTHLPLQHIATLMPLLRLWYRVCKRPGLRWRCVFSSAGLPPIRASLVVARRADTFQAVLKFVRQSNHSRCESTKNFLGSQFFELLSYA